MIPIKSVYAVFHFNSPLYTRIYSELKLYPFTEYTLIKSLDLEIRSSTSFKVGQIGLAVGNIGEPSMRKGDGRGREVVYIYIYSDKR